MKLGLTACLLLSVVLRGAGGDVKNLLNSILNAETDKALPSKDQFYSQVTREAIGALSPPEVQDLLPLIQRCLASPRLEVRRYGLLTAMAVSFRPDSSQTLEPIIGDIERIASNPTSPLKGGALAILGNTYPHPSQRAVSYLEAHLQDKDNSTQQLTTIAVSLMRASGPGSALWRKVLTFVENQPDPGVKAAVLMELGNEKAGDASSEEFIKASLSSKDLFIQGAAIETVGQLDASARVNFVDQLKQIMNDPNESPENRKQAKAALTTK